MRLDYRVEFPTGKIPHHILFKLWKRECMFQQYRLQTKCGKRIQNRASVDVT